MTRRITHAGREAPADPAEACQHVDAKPVLVPGPGNWPTAARLCMTCGEAIPDPDDSTESR